MQDNQTILTPTTLSFSSFILVLLLLIFIYTETLIFKSILYIFLGILLGVYYFFNRIKHTKNPKADKLMIFTLSLIVVCSLSSYVYSSWNFLYFFSISTASKITLFISTVLVSYLNLMYIRFEHSYKRKRGNQRIQKEPEPSFFEQLTQNFRSNEKEDEIQLYLGRTAENDDLK